VRALVGAFGTRGDVQAGVVVARALIARGHAVSLAVSPSSLALARSQGLEARPVGLDYEAISVRAGHGTLWEMAGMLPLLRADMRVQHQALEADARVADVIIGASLLLVGSMLSEALGKPYVFVCPVPQVFESTDYPSPGIPFQRLPRWLNRVSWSFNRGLFNGLLLGSLNEVRGQLGLSRAGDVVSSWIGRDPILAADPALAPTPAGHGPAITQVGALFLEDATELSEPTRAFLDAGPAPVYIGFGSMPDPDPARTTRRLLESVRRAGVRAVIASGWARLGAETAPAEVLFVGSEPHNRLFPRCAAIVHHGGAGTTHAAARSGVPQVVMPYLLDQHFWAHRAWLAGISSRAVRRHGRDPEPLARAIRRCFEDDALRERARDLAPRIATDGATCAAERIERITSQAGATASDYS
jgi:UDP:flavonoid glycosyltransferase YjiC (YdhE family)